MKILECSICTDPVFVGHKKETERAYRCWYCDRVLCHPCATGQGCQCTWTSSGAQYAEV